MDQTNPRQQIIDRLAQANNILVTVSRDPSVDQLAACIGMTLLLNKLGKHATAVFSGKVPTAIDFLNPEETLESNADSLRDFIIALDKSKADKLRYKVEDQFVKIFITPYRTTLSEEDLEFSQGDFNVEVVLAIGVQQRDELDQAIVAHGRILHDAVVVTINNDQTSELGAINWNAEQASSLSEMLVDIGEAVGREQIDAQIATAFLTGIVAETDRFSNQRTTPQTMMFSGHLIEAGANPQLVATKLEVKVQQSDEGSLPLPPRGGADSSASSPKATNTAKKPSGSKKSGTTTESKNELKIDNTSEQKPTQSSEMSDSATSDTGQDALPEVKDVKPTGPAATPTESTKGPSGKSERVVSSKPEGKRIDPVTTNDTSSVTSSAAQPPLPSSPKIGGPGVNPAANPLFTTPPKAPEPPAPDAEADSTQTLHELEQSVKSEEPRASKPDDSSLDEAKKAVEAALAGSPEAPPLDPSVAAEISPTLAPPVAPETPVPSPASSDQQPAYQPPDPLAGLPPNLVPPAEPPKDGSTGQVINPQSPPPVPPPMMPPPTIPPAGNKPG